MTEESFQQGREIMQKANYWRGVITTAKGNVAKWTKIEMSHRENLREAQANGAKKMLEKALKRLEEVREKFSELKFPEDNLPFQKLDYDQCENCGTKVSKGTLFCKECLS